MYHLFRLTSRSYLIKCYFCFEDNCLWNMSKTGESRLYNISKERNLREYPTDVNLQLSHAAAALEDGYVTLFLCHKTRSHNNRNVWYFVRGTWHLTNEKISIVYVFKEKPKIYINFYLAQVLLFGVKILRVTNLLFIQFL